MMVDFTLTYGMKNDDLLKEILMNRVNNNNLLKHTLQDLNLFRGFPRKHELIDSNILGYTILSTENARCSNAANHVKDWDSKWMSKKYITHEVVAVDKANNYAIIQHNVYQVHICEMCRREHISSLPSNQNEIPYSPSYILCGLNSDDEKYFLHPLINVPDELINKTKNHGDIISVVKWCNKEDLGFERLQGDIVFAEIEPRISEILAHKDYIDEVIYEFTIGKSTKMRIGLNFYSQPGVKFTVGNWQHDLKSLVSFIKIRSEQQDTTIGDRHELKTDGIITRLLNERLSSEMQRWSSVERFNTVVILGSELIVRHPEHPTVKKQIPTDKALLLSMQRGSEDDWPAD